VRMTVIGAGPAYTDRQDASGACYLVEHGSTRVLLDLGQGSFPRIFPLVPPEDLDAIVVSHLHPDHFVDLVPLRHYLRYQLQPSRRMLVLGPSDLAGRLDALHAEPGFSAQALDTQTLGLGTRRIGDLEMQAGLVAHTDESYAVRVSIAGDPADGDGSGGADGSRPGLVYSGDCGRPQDIARLVRPGDTLLAEVSFGTGPVPADVLHLDGPMVGRLATGTGAGRVLLTHLQMGFDPDATVASCRALYDGPVEMVWPGTSTEI
jgi:ribonuclease BN (tRNA processing enzyme)